MFESVWNPFDHIDYRLHGGNRAAAVERLTHMANLDRQDDLDAHLRSPRHRRNRYGKSPAAEALFRMS